MNDHHAFAYQEAVERTSYPRASAWPQLEQPVAKCPRMGKAKMRAVVAEKLDQTGVIGEHIHGPRLDLSRYPRVEILDLERHRKMLANTLTTGNARGDVEVDSAHAQVG